MSPALCCKSAISHSVTFTVISSSLRPEIKLLQHAIIQAITDLNDPVLFTQSCLRQVQAFFIFFREQASSRFINPNFLTLTHTRQGPPRTRKVAVEIDPDTACIPTVSIPDVMMMRGNWDVMTYLWSRRYCLWAECPREFLLLNNENGIVRVMYTWYYERKYVCV